MSATRIIGLVLVAAGVVVVLWGGIFWTRDKTFIDAGPLEVKTQQHEGVSLPPIAGAAALVAGIVLVVAGGGRRHRA